MLYKVCRGIKGIGKAFERIPVSVAIITVAICLSVGIIINIRTYIARYIFIDRPVAMDLVKGKVTLDGQPITGKVCFFSIEQKKEWSTITTVRGEYIIANAPKGDCLIYFKETSDTQQKFPEKYSRPDNGLKINVSGREQIFDIKLEH